MISASFFVQVISALLPEYIWRKRKNLQVGVYLYQIMSNRRNFIKIYVWGSD